MRTGGTTMPRSAAILRRSALTRSSRSPPALRVDQVDQVGGRARGRAGRPGSPPRAARGCPGRRAPPGLLGRRAGLLLGSLRPDAGRREQHRAAGDDERQLGQARDQAQAERREAGDPQRHAGLAAAGAVMSVPMSASPVARVTIRPVATEISSAGICETRPSPTVSRLYVVTASPKRHAHLERRRWRSRRSG